MNLKKAFMATFLGMTLMVGSASAQVSYQQVRNATGKLAYNDTVFLIDPMLAEKGRYKGFEDCFNPELRNPMIELPQSKEEVMSDVDAVIVTHTHLDHWDEVAQQFIRKDMPIFAQDEKDAKTIRDEGFTDVRILKEGTVFQDVTLHYVEATHGTQAMYDDPVAAAGLGESMGIVFTAPNEKSTYVMGDTVWTQRVNKTLNNYQPDILIMNTGYAKALKYNEGIIMGTADVARAAAIMPKSKLVAVHMDAINHCTVSRKNMREFVRQNKLDKRVYVPNDGETISF